LFRVERAAGLGAFVVQMGAGDVVLLLCRCERRMGPLRSRHERVMSAIVVQTRRTA